MLEGKFAPHVRIPQQVVAEPSLVHLNGESHTDLVETPRGPINQRNSACAISAPFGQCTSPFGDSLSIEELVILHRLS